MNLLWESSAQEQRLTVMQNSGKLHINFVFAQDEWEKSIKMIYCDKISLMKVIIIKLSFSKEKKSFLPDWISFFSRLCSLSPCKLLSQSINRYCFHFFLCQIINYFLIYHFEGLKHRKVLIRISFDWNFFINYSWSNTANDPAHRKLIYFISLFHSMALSFALIK